VSTRKKKKAAPKSGGRTRTAAVQVYLSSAELRAFARLCKAMHVTRSEAVRQWIRLADADRKLQAAKPPAVDPRQMDVTELLTDGGK
jgi:Ribbon-helix-helix protein, copG family